VQSIDPPRDVRKLHFGYVAVIEGYSRSSMLNVKKLERALIEISYRENDVPAGTVLPCVY
jgi:hypothetical protein